MDEKAFPQSKLPIRRTVDFLPNIFRTTANEKFFAGAFDPLIQPGVLDRIVGYVGRRYGKTFNGSSIYLDTNETLRSRYQLEPGVITTDNEENITDFYDYLDFKNQLNFFGTTNEKDNKLNFQEHYSWNPPIDWDKFVNYREYYWLPLGPSPVAVEGQRQGIQSTYKVKQGIGSGWVFTPDGYSINPELILYRGQTYEFNVNSPGEGFTLRTNYDTGSLLFVPNRDYSAGELAVYDGKLWRAKQDVDAGDGSSIDIDSQDWELLDKNASRDSLDYTDGVTNNGVKKGILTFTVPLDAPDHLYYQSDIDPFRLGRFIIADIDTNTLIDVEKEILGKSYYTSSNDVEFTNGLIVEFKNTVLPEKYATGTWLIEGVGNKIELIKFEDLVAPTLTSDVPEVLYDNEGFDTQPFDDATSFPSVKDYITISRSSKDNNPWSRYNRWFHRNAIERAYAEKGRVFEAPETARAKRPIIEFLPNLKLFNYGINAKQTVDYVDDYTTDVFSKIEGSSTYNVDGEFLFAGARILVVADTDSLANNKIYKVNFITHNGKRQINLVETEDAESVLGDCVLVRRGNKNSGTMLHYDGSKWVKSQEKTTVNQPPKFDVFNENGVSLGNAETYPSNTFNGCNILSYKQGNGRIDPELGFPLSYLNIDNVGDIEFNWDWDTDTFTWTEQKVNYSKKISTGFYELGSEYVNGWIRTSNDRLQPIIDSTVLIRQTTGGSLLTVDWDEFDQLEESIIKFYLNGYPLRDTYTRRGNTFYFDNTTFNENDVLSVKILADIEPKNGYYELPEGLEKNPLNEELKSFTLGQALDHLNSSLEFDDRFDGVIPGPSNLRDLSDYQQHAKRFMKHAGITPLSVKLLCDKTYNIIKSIEYSKNQYSSFKNNLINKSTEIDFNENIADFLDDIIKSLTITKNIESPFADTDMIGTGAYNSIDYEVEDTGIKTFALSEKFDLTEMSRKAVYVYLNNRQLLNGADYEFDGTFGFVRLFVDLAEGDRIQIREYVTTAFCHIPPTPTVLGMYKKYRPMKFIDDTYSTPREVIQGHDGSIIFTYGDFRDDLILELELRIYNNIKIEYDHNVFDLDKVVSSYYGYGLYSKSEFDDIVTQTFLKWINNTNTGYTLNEYFDSEDSFTYTYSNMTDPTDTKNIPGWWRGVYKWFYDTDRPHVRPWEMLGFSEKPDWWEEEYGPAPYTRGNLILWEDLEAGIIRQGDRAGIVDRYKRPGILNHLPVDDEGNLLSPLDSGLANNFTLINNKGPFVLGDVAPVEYAWRSSSDWPFAVTIAMCLLRPFDFITSNLNRSVTTRNVAGQLVNKNTLLYQTLEDITVPVAGVDLSAGLINYVASYAKSFGVDASNIVDALTNLDVKLSTRLSGFVDKNQHKYLLDSKNPSSSSGNIYIPPENYDIIFNVSTPVRTLTYSGVIVQKTEGGWIVTGYDDTKPYFEYFQPRANQKDPTISVGGISESFVTWKADQLYNNGVVAEYNGTYYRCLKTHTSTTSFDTTVWAKLPKLPLVGAVEFQKRRNFNNLKVLRLSYGTKFIRIQELVDFLLGYEAYLKSEGFLFNNYDGESQVAQDWTTACKEFVFWNKHNWAIGSLITLSPAASTIEIDGSVGVVDNLLDSFYDYNVLQGNGQPLDPKYIDVKRDFKKFIINTKNTSQGIYYLKLHFVLKEHITVFDHRTVFNDIIFDKATGYRQERIKSQGFRTVDWDGDYTSPGFIFDNVSIEKWTPFQDYRLGDIVGYKSKYWTSKSNHIGTETFNANYWTILDSNPTKSLIPNFDYRIAEFEDYFDVSTDGLSDTQRQLARHAIGYQTREYLENLAEDPVTQFQLYQGFIREKGTANSINKVFDKLSVRQSGGSIELNEEWAFRIGELGGTDQIVETEIELFKNKFETDPQPLIMVKNDPGTFIDFYYRVPEEDFTIKSIPFTTDVNLLSYDAEPIRTAGYVKSDQPTFVIRNRDDLLTGDISAFNDNDHIWVTFDNDTWTVLRFHYAQELLVVNAVLGNNNDAILTINKPHNIEIGDIIGIKTIVNLVGFFKVSNVETVKDGIFNEYYVTIEVPENTQEPEIDQSTYFGLYVLQESRFNSYNDIELQSAALLKDGSKLWIDHNENGLWEVVQKQKQYSYNRIADFGITDPIKTGYKVLYNNTTTNILASMPPAGYVMSYIETSSGLKMKQIVAPPDDFKDNLNNSFGLSMAKSPDDKWLIIGAPNASGISSAFNGIFDPSETYLTGDIVLYDGKLWKATRDVIGDGSTINVYSEDWEPALVIEGYDTGTHPGFSNQGAVFAYEYADQQWNLRYTLLSPRPDENELFGSSVVIGKTTTGYTMIVSATGSLNEKGRVYIFNYDSTNKWYHAENPNYRGRYDNTGSTFYPKGSIVWQESAFWEATADNYGDGSTITLLSNDWVRLDSVVTQCSLPQSVSLEDDGSTLASGMLTSTQLAELIKYGDKFGTTLTTNYDASVLVVGSPQADGQYFANYQGIWRPDVEYVEGAVVQYQDHYHKLINDGWHPVDSTIRSYNQPPDEGLPWTNVGDSSAEPIGKAHVYRRNEYGVYNLDQTITAGSLEAINDLNPDETISSGDLFAHAMSLDYSGNTLVISSPKADINYQNQGSAYVFKYDSDSSFLQFRLKQKLESYEQYPNEYFGQSICISPNTGMIAVGANNSPFDLPVRFDSSTTSFDEGRTSFSSKQGFAGSVYVYELKDGRYLLTEKLETDLSLNESFGWSVACTDSKVIVGSPDYIEPNIQLDGFVLYDGSKTGTVRAFTKQSGVSSFKVLTQQTPVVDFEKLKNIALYDNVNDLKIQDVDIVDHAKLKILDIAEQELKFKTLYDPATYTIGTDSVVVDARTAWSEKNVGQLWWDLSTAKWVHYEQGDIAYRVGNWNSLAFGASIDVYEWVKTRLLPSEWSVLADTNEGLAVGISGQPKHPDDTVYSVKQFYNPVTGEVVDTYYYFWVKSTTVIPADVVGRRISAATVSLLIENPSSLNITYLSLIDSDKLLAYNFDNVISTDTALLNIQYYKDIEVKNPVHNEYQLLSEGVATSVPSTKLEEKWIDSIVGYDKEGNRVPDPNLPEKQKYGLKFRPRQSMFKDRLELLRMMVDRVNGILELEPFANIIDFDNLNSFEEEPSSLLNLYDESIQNYIDLQTVGTIRIRTATLSANIVDGEIASVDIIDSGYGYKVAPPVEIKGNGSGAEATCTIDNQGQVVSVTVTSKGRKYTKASASVRPYSVLISSDENSNGFWGIYAWDDDRRSFFRIRSQSFDTRRYWQYKDWWKAGYGVTSRIVAEFSMLYEENLLNLNVGDLIKVKEYGAGGWAVFEKISDTELNPFDNLLLVGRELGTIELLSTIYDTTLSGIGYDNNRSFDTGLYDVENSAEVRKILAALKDDIFNGDYENQWNLLFFSCIRYALAEQHYINWAFKTSFLTATHTIGCFCRRPNFKNDGLSYYADYIDEVKPYRTTVRKYISRYQETDDAPTGVADFDLPVAYDTITGTTTPVNKSDYRITQYPWKWWYDNNGFSIVEIQVSAPGEEYTSVPKVVIEGNGTGAEAQAYISNGRLVGVRVINEGSGYTVAPTVRIVGGNPSGAAIGKAVAILGNTVARTVNVGIKFDRITKDGVYRNYEYEETFVASGSSGVFNLSYAPTRDKSKIQVTRNNQVALADEYTISLYKSSTDTFSLLKGKITFTPPPETGDVIKIVYEKNDELLDSVNRIDKYYNPSLGMKGKELGQLMTGIDFGGVQVQGTTFEVTGGWDALPWFTDGWDSVEAASDYYVVCDGSTSFITLPYTPEAGQELNIYLRRVDPNSPIIRIDDPNYDNTWDSSSVTNPHAQMPTFYGDGSTNTVLLEDYLETQTGDILIFRPVESDGSVTISDPNLLDTKISGGSLAVMNGAYATANGTSAEEIVIEGGKFIDPDQVLSPEENVPGQVLDSFSIKVFQIAPEGAAPVQSKIILADGTERFFAVGQNILENNSVLVYVDKSKKIAGVDYEIDFVNNVVELLTAPVTGSVIEIISIGIGGMNLLDYQEFEADGDTSLFLTDANYDDTSNVFVTVNGIEKDVGFVNSTDVVDTTDRTLIEFAEKPARFAAVKIICLSAATDVDSTQLPIVRINSQEITIDGSSRNFDLDNFVNLSRGSAYASMLVEVNGTALRGVDSKYVVYDGTNNVFQIGTDPFEAAGAILPTNIRVLINNVERIFVTDYVYNGTSKEITVLEDKLSIGDEIVVENDFRAEYSIIGNNIVIDSDVALNPGDKVEITWFGEYPSMKMISDEYTGGKIHYRLTREPLSASYVWVYKNGIRLTQDIDYSVLTKRKVVELINETTENDLIKIVMFGVDTYKLPSAYEIYKDMLNVYHFKRFSETEVTLAKDLYYYDLTIEVTDASVLDTPLPSRNIPGVVIINNERIEYLQKTGNILSQLRRGSLGSSIKELSPKGTPVVNTGVEESLPYKENQDRVDFYSDGSSLLIGPIGFVPEKSASSSWFRNTIPNDFGQCDTIEVFGAGTRLRKMPVTVFDETISATSPAGDKQIEAEFSVDGINDYIRLTQPLPAGTRISIIRKIGNTWYDRGENTATSGITLLENNSPIARFIAEKTTKLPE